MTEKEFRKLSRAQQIKSSFLFATNQIHFGQIGLQFSTFGSMGCNTG